MNRVKDAINYIKYKFKVDAALLWSLILLFIFGTASFFSAALGVMERNQDKFYAITSSQLFQALPLAIIGLSIGVLFPLAWHYKLAPYYYISALALSTLVFVPSLSLHHNGASRWLDIAGITLQPSETFKFALVAATSWLCVKYKKYILKKYIGIIYYGIFMIPLLVVMGLQKDMGTLLIILAGSVASLFISGIKARIVTIGAVLGIITLSLLIILSPFRMQRVTTFLNPEADAQGKGYHIIQSLIAVGRGGAWGQGYGQSVQKFGTYLPEATSDSIFAIIGEEWGFVFTSIFVILVAYIVLRGYYIAINSRDMFSKSLAAGITTLFGMQSILNMASMLALMPLTGVPLPFVSHGGTALAIMATQMGILLNISHENLN